MPKISQFDILDNNISLTKLGNFTITTTSTFLQGNVSITSYALGLSTAFAASAPLQIHDGVNASVTGFSEEQDVTIYNASCTTVIPWFDSSSGTVVPTTGSASITTGDLVGIYGAGSWSVGPNTNFSRFGCCGATGSQKAAILMGGSNVDARTSEVFNGSAWFLSANLVLTTSIAPHGGSQNSAWIAGDSTANMSTITQLFNGSAWGSSGNMVITGFEFFGAGSQNAAMASGGQRIPGNTFLTSTELFNGSTWSNSNNMILSRSTGASGGSQNASYASCGFNAVASSAISTTELFNGSSWAMSGNTTISRVSPAGAGTQNAAIVAGGDDNALHKALSSELFNGSAWYVSGSTSISRTALGVAGAQNGAVAAGGGFVTSELHNQTLYRKLTFNNFKEAKNIGIATDVVPTSNGATGCNVKVVGYLNNVAITSGNIAITTAAQWTAGYYAALSRFSPNINTTNNPTSIIVKSSIEADDYLVGQIVSQTEMIVFNSNIYTKDNTGIW